MDNKYRTNLILLIAQSFFNDFTKILEDFENEDKLKIIKAMQIQVDLYEEYEIGLNEELEKGKTNYIKEYYNKRQKLFDGLIKQFKGKWKKAHRMQLPFYFENSVLIFQHDRLLNFANNEQSYKNLDLKREIEKAGKGGQILTDKEMSGLLNSYVRILQNMLDEIYLELDSEDNLLDNNLESSNIKIEWLGGINEFSFLIRQLVDNNWIKFEEFNGKPAVRQSFNQLRKIFAFKGIKGIPNLDNFCNEYHKKYPSDFMLSNYKIKPRRKKG